MSVVDAEETEDLPTGAREQLEAARALLTA